MGEKTPKLVVVDEDGTFLDLGGKEFSRERFSRVFDRMTAASCRFAVATSNQSFQVEEVFGELASQVGIIASNGAFVADGHKVLDVRRACSEAVSRVVAVHAEHPEIPLCAVCEKGAWVEPWTDPDFVANMTLYSCNMREVQSLGDACATDSVLMYWSRVPEAELACSVGLFRDALGDLMDVVDSGCEDGWGYFDVVQRGVSKASGASRLMDCWGIAAQDVIAFGDAGNDVEMLKLAGTGYAMGNADDAVKAAADRVCAPCREQGVLRVLEEIFVA